MENINARVDIIIPVYNVEPFLRRCLNSIKAQTCQNWRAICIDDGSQDRSSSILDEYSKADGRFTVVHTKNGGISRARNIGMDMASSEFIMFVDSDDLIHPQTLELALGLADRDGTDIVSWYRDTRYRTQIEIARKFGMDTVGMRPWGYRRKYSLNKVKYLVTNNLLEHCTDMSHTDIRWPIKHFHIWKHLFRRSSIEDVRFIEGLDFEDFPWWTEVILRELKATITRLPLYYRYLNLKSITRQTGEEDKLICFLRGLEYTIRLYSEKASQDKQELFNRNIKWSVIELHVFKVLDKIKDEQKLLAIKDRIKKLWDDGVFDDCYTKNQQEARNSISRFIGVNA